jgi:hypothetical protein
MSFEWTIGEDENNVSHRRLIDTGGFGEIHGVVYYVYCVLI